MISCSEITIVQYHAGTIDKKRQECIASVDKYLSKHRIIRIIEDAREDAVRHSDIKRIWLSREYAPALWVDTDWMANGEIKFDFDLSLPAFAYNDGRPDNFMFYMPNIESVDLFLRIREMRKIQPGWGWMNKVLREYLHNEIKNDGSWDHLRLSGYSALEESYKTEISSDEYFLKGY